MIIQQLKAQILDLSTLLLELVQVMKKICAPSRDQIIMDLEYEIKYQAPSESLRKMFVILDAMMVDYANFKLQQLRIVLIQNGANVERRAFNRNLVKTRMWLQATVERMREELKKRNPENIQNGDSYIRFDAAYNEGLLSLIFEDPAFPETLEMDRTRISLLKETARRLGVAAAVSVLSQRFQISNNIAQEILRIFEQVPSENVAAAIKSKVVGGEHIQGMIVRALQGKDPVYGVMMRRLQMVLRLRLTGQAGGIERSGLEPVAEEVEVLADRVWMVADWNKKVHGRHYDGILQDLISNHFQN